MTTLLSALTLTLILVLTGCSNMHPPRSESAAAYEYECKNRAYVHQVLSEYLTNRFHSQAPARMAIIPFSVPANLSAQSIERPGLGNELAWKLQSELVRKQAAPIIEILNRHDWPGKKEEFGAGNFGAIATAREAGYDLVLVGSLDTVRSLDSLSLVTKLIDVESRITIWNGTSTVSRDSTWMHDSKDYLGLARPVPSAQHFGPLVDDLVRCARDGITSEDPLL